MTKNIEAIINTGVLIKIEQNKKAGCLYNYKDLY